MVPHENWSPQKRSYSKQIARKLHIQYFEGIVTLVTLKSGVWVTQGPRKWHHLIDRMRVTISVS